MIVHNSWWSNGSARSTIIDYHEPFDQGFTLPSCSLNYPVHPEFTLDIVHSLNTWTKRNAPSGFTGTPPYVQATSLLQPLSSSGLNKSSVGHLLINEAIPSIRPDFCGF